MNTPLIVRPLLALALSGLLVACGQNDSPTPASATPSTPSAPSAPSAPAAPVVGAAAQRGPLWLDPLSSCDTGQVTTLHWESALFARGPVEIRVGEKIDGGLFAKVGGAGMKQTGPWMKPGAVIVARAADGTEVGRVVAAGPNCAK